MKSCETCWYGEQEVGEVCQDCLANSNRVSSFPKWVSKDFLSHVEDAKDPVGSMTWTANYLTQKAPSFKANNIGELLKQKLQEGIKEAPKGIKFDHDKPRWELIPFRALQEVVEVLTYGSKKYADDNWKIVPGARSRYISAAFRHFTASIDGEKNDKETGKSHLAHAVCCLLFLLWFEQEDKCVPSSLKK